MMTIIDLKDSKNAPKNIWGIYCIKAKYAEKYYVGQTQHAKGFFGRFQDHKDLLRANKHDNIYLQRSYNKHGEDAFEFRILEVCNNRDLLNKREHYWITYYKSMYNEAGWNIDYVDPNGKRRADKNSRSKEFEIMMPDGSIYKGKNRKEFAIKHGLDDGGFCRVINGERASIKGFKSLHPNIINKKIKTYKLRSPEGEIFEFSNIYQFCKERFLSYSNFVGVCNGNIASSGLWTNPEFDKKFNNPFSYINFYYNSEKTLISNDFKIHKFKNIKLFSSKYKIGTFHILKMLKDPNYSYHGWANINYNFKSIINIDTEKIIIFRFKAKNGHTGFTDYDLFKIFKQGKIINGFKKNTNPLIFETVIEDF